MFRFEQSEPSQDVLKRNSAKIDFSAFKKQNSETYNKSRLKILEDFKKEDLERKNLEEKIETNLRSLTDRLKRGETVTVNNRKYTADGNDPLVLNKVIEAY